MAGECWSHVVRVAADSDSYSEPPGWGWPGNKGQLKTYHLASSLLPAAAAISLSVHMLSPVTLLTLTMMVTEKACWSVDTIILRPVDGSWGTKKAAAVVTWRPQACPRIMSLLSPAQGWGLVSMRCLAGRQCYPLYRPLPTVLYCAGCTLPLVESCLLLPGAAHVRCTVQYSTVQYSAALYTDTFVL